MNGCKIVRRGGVRAFTSLATVLGAPGAHFTLITLEVTRVPTVSVCLAAREHNCRVRECCLCVLSRQQIHSINFVFENPQKFALKKAGSVKVRRMVNMESLAVIAEENHEVYEQQQGK